MKFTQNRKFPNKINTSRKYLSRLPKPHPYSAPRKECAVTTQHHDILPRIIMHLLSLALYAERAALRPLAARLQMCQILLPGWRAALFLIELPEDPELSDSVLDALDCSQHRDSTAMLAHLALVFRAIAAITMHACLTGGTMRRQRPRHEIALSLNLPACRVYSAIGLNPDTS
jgi:hypothetical protein